MLIPTHASKHVCVRYSLLAGLRINSQFLDNLATAAMELWKANVCFRGDNELNIAGFNEMIDRWVVGLVVEVDNK